MSHLTVYLISAERINIMRKMVIVIGWIALLGCSSAYYGTMEKLGYYKRDLKD